MKGIVSVESEKRAMKYHVLLKLGRESVLDHL